MNLVSCAKCGIVLDKDRLNFPMDTWDFEKEEPDLSKCEWTGDGYTAICPCPVCSENIKEYN